MRARFLSLLPIIVGFTLLTPSLSFASNFSDVPETHLNFQAVQILKDANLVSGYADGTFKPDNQVSRAEALAMILKSSGTAIQESGKVQFTDVSAQDWFFPMVRTGVSLGKLKGYEDNTFRPNNPVTLPEALALTLSFFKISTKGITADAVIYRGLDANAWYGKQAQYAKNNNLIEPDERGFVDAASPLTRAKLAEMIFRMRTVQQTGIPFDITQKWIFTEHADNFWKIKHPADWEIFKGLQNSVIWKRAPSQVFFTRTWPSSARLSVSLAPNPENLSAYQYFAKLKQLYNENYSELKPKFLDMTLDARPALKIIIPEERIIDAAIQLPNGNFLVMYGEYGKAPIGEFLKKQLELVIASYKYVEKPPEPPKPVIPLEERMQALRENILIADKWKEIAPNFPDKKLIHTDAIGVGTGPVDYYYSPEANHTIKLERSTGTVLNIKEGNSSAF